MERYIYNHTHYHQAIADLREREKYQDSIQKATCKVKFDLANENLFNTLEAGRAYKSELLCVSDLVSRLPEEIKHKYDDIALGDLTVQKIADKLEVYRNRHLKAKAKINAPKEVYSYPEEDDEPSIEAVASKKKWTSKMNWFQKFNPSSSTQKSQNQTGTSEAAKNRLFCLHCKKEDTSKTTASADNGKTHPATARKVNPFP